MNTISRFLELDGHAQPTQSALVTTESLAEGDKPFVRLRAMSFTASSNRRKWNNDQYVINVQYMYDKDPVSALLSNGDITTLRTLIVAAGTQLGPIQYMERSGYA